MPPTEEHESFASGLVVFDPEDSCFVLTVGVLASAGWSDIPKTETRLIFEFTGEGQARLHRFADAHAHLERLRENVRESSAGATEKENALQTLADKFREVAFHRSDKNRVTLKEVERRLLFWPTMQPPSRLFLHARTNMIDVLTEDARVRRAMGKVASL